MQSRTVLSVGHCALDHAALVQFLQSRFDVRVDRADSAVDALHRLADHRYDLVLVNRVLDADGSPGTEVLRQIRQRPEVADVPVMLVSNQKDSQDNWESLGGQRGFGKAEFSAIETAHKLQGLLG